MEAATMKMDDPVLGKAITGEFGSGERRQCPTLEEIAALVDDALTPAERDDLMGHLAGCDTCRQIFIATRQLAKEEGTIGGRRRYMIPSVLATAAVLVVAVTLTLKPSPPGNVRFAQKEVPAPSPVVISEKSGVQSATKEGGAAPQEGASLPTSDRMARILARNSDPKGLAALTDVRDDSYGFAAKGDGKNLAFHIGMNSMALEIALIADDSDRAQAQAVRLGALLQAVTGDNKAVDLEGLAEKLEKGEKPSNFAGRSGMVERALTREDVLYVRLGAWAEGARLAAKAGNREYFAGGVPRYFREGLAAAGAPGDAASVLRNLDQKVKDPKKIDLRSVETAIDELIRAI